MGYNSELDANNTELQEILNAVNNLPDADSIEGENGESPEIIITGNTDGYWYNKDGVPTYHRPGEGQVIASKETNYIVATEGDMFRVSTVASDGHNATGGWYDANKNLIANCLIQNANGSVQDTTQIVTAPAGTAYARFFCVSWSGDLDGMNFDVVYLGKADPSTNAPVSPLKGKKIVYDGDSICSSWGISTNGGSYPQIIADIVDGTFDNQGVGGGRIVTQEGSSDTFHSIVDNLVNLPKDGDLYCFEGGVNDHWHYVPLGTFSESDYTSTVDKTTYCGALETIFRYATTHFVGKPICFIITHKCPGSAFSKYGDNTFADFRNAALGICEKYSIPVYDAWKDSGINSWNASQLANYFIDSGGTGTGDGTHPNEEGYRRYYVPQLIDLFERIMPIGATNTEPIPDPELPSYTNVLDTVGWTADKRLSGSKGTLSDNTGTMVSGQIAVTPGDIIYLKNVEMPNDLLSSNLYRNQIGCYKSDGTFTMVLNVDYTLSNLDGKSDGTNITQFKIVSGMFNGDTSGFIRIGCVSIDETSIITINEPIE